MEIGKVVKVFVLPDTRYPIPKTRYPEFYMATIDSEKILEALEERMKNIRPSLRQEYKDIIGDGFKGMGEAEFKEKIFDYDRAPFIEKKGIDQAKVIIWSVPVRNFPDSGIFLLTALHRLELHFYDLVRPVEEVKEEDAERRTLMYKTGVRKALREAAALLPEKTARVWAFRRRMLDSLESSLWKLDLGLAGKGGKDGATDLREMADTLHAMAPAELSAMESPEALAGRFSAECGSAAEALAARFAEKRRD